MLLWILAHTTGLPGAAQPSGPVSSGDGAVVSDIAPASDLAGSSRECAQSMANRARDAACALAG